MPVRQWVLSLRIPLRLLLAAQPKLVTPVFQVVHRVITRHLLGQAGLKAGEADSGAVTLIQRFGSAANLNIHLHCLVLDGVYRCGTDGEPEFVEVPAPTDGPHAQAAAGGSLHLSHRLRPARRTEGADTAGRHAQGYGLQAEPVRRHAGFQPARRRCAAAPTSARRENHGLAEPDRQQRDPALAIGRQIQGNADAPDQGRGLEHGRRESCRIIGRPARYPARPEAP
ncbi:MAG: transposase [Burkholderiaceae bacterium]|nr:transposase [Burkholderiaceae bacterium]